MEITEEKALPIREVPGYVAGIDFKMLSSALPYMYTDKPERIDFLAYEGIIDQVIEWFGRDINIEKTDREEWIKISLIASPNAMVHWAMQYGDNVEIISPQSLRQTVADKFKKSLEMYK
jgi:predicted DNA-binding transcriptional regulator YafY